MEWYLWLLLGIGIGLGLAQILPARTYMAEWPYEVMAQYTVPSHEPSYIATTAYARQGSADIEASYEGAYEGSAYGPLLEEHMGHEDMERRRQALIEALRERGGQNEVVAEDRDI